MSYFYGKESRRRTQDFGDAWEDFQAASGFLYPSAEASEAPSNDTFVPPETPLVLAPPPEPEPVKFKPDPEMWVSEHYQLKDLIVTSLPYSNLPDDQESLDNLIKMGTLLDAIRDNIGTFNIASVYRSQANQDYLRKSNTMAVAKSYHSLGLAADLTPTNGMSTADFARALYQNPVTNVLLGQIVDKAEGGQTSLHVSLPTSKFPKATPMYVGAGDQYYRMTESEIGKWLSSKISDVPGPSEESFSSDPDEALSEEEMNEDSPGLPWGMLGAGLAVIAGYFFYRKRK